MKHGFYQGGGDDPEDPGSGSGVQCGRDLSKGTERGISKGAKIIVFPELCITGYTCGDFFLQELLALCRRREALDVWDATEGSDALVVRGLRWRWRHKLYNVAGVCRTESAGFYPEALISHPMRSFYEARHFMPGNEEPEITFFMERGACGDNICSQWSGARPDGGLRSCCEDLWAPLSAARDIRCGSHGAGEPVGFNETVGKDVYREMLGEVSSANLIAGYVYASAGEASPPRIWSSAAIT